MDNEYTIVFANVDDYTKKEKNNNIANKNDVISVFTNNFKQRKFLKTKQTWKKNLGEVTLVCNIQNSQWSREDYYVNVGVLINEFSHLPHAYGTLDERIDLEGSAEDIFKRVLDWFDSYGSVEKLINASKNKEFADIDCKYILKLLNIDIEE